MDEVIKVLEMVSLFHKPLAWIRETWFKLAIAFLSIFLADLTNNPNIKLPNVIQIAACQCVRCLEAGVDTYAQENFQ